MKLLKKKKKADNNLEFIKKRNKTGGTGEEVCSALLSSSEGSVGICFCFGV